MEITIATSAIIVFLVVFFGVGIFVTARTLVRIRSAEREGRGEGSMREVIRARVGPVTPERAPLNGPLRVLVEFICSLFGFPGLGWSLSTRLAPGIGMMLVGPIFCWMVYPILLHNAGILATDPYALIKELPFIAAASAGTLAVLEFRAAGRRHGHHTA